MAFLIRPADFVTKLPEEVFLAPEMKNYCSLLTNNNSFINSIKRRGKKKKRKGLGMVWLVKSASWDGSLANLTDISICLVGGGSSLCQGKVK